MSKKSGVYLVSSKPMESNNVDKPTFDNLGFHSSETKVTYSATNGVDLPEIKPVPDKPYRGMGKEDLLHFSSQPFWRRLRMICVTIVLVGWLALIIAVVALVLVYPRCRDPASRTWWQKEAVYRIYVPSFKDSNDDGVGDLAGIESKLDYIKDLGFFIISLSPIYKTASSASFGSGNDMAITDHTDIDPNYGTMADFEKLLDTAKSKDMYVVLDFIPNHTSDQHSWFLDSSDRTNNKTNFYVWSDGNTEPNNWKGHYGGSAWNLGVTRNQKYLHQFRPETPDLNLRSAMVREELEYILTFWLDRKVDGFNVRDAGFLFEDYDLRNEPQKPGTSGAAYDDFDHIYTSDQPEVYDILKRWRTVLRQHNETDTEKLLMVGLEGNLNPTELYGDCDVNGVQMPLNNGLQDKTSSCDGNCMTNYVEGWMNKTPDGRWANWMTGDEDTSRFSNRFNATFVQAYAVLTFLLPGTPVFYYGDEINMVDTGSSGSAWTRDRKMRAIKPWDNTTNGGFCNISCTPWTEVGDVSTGDIQNEFSDLIKSLMGLRAKMSFRVGEYHPSLEDDAIVSFVREFDGEPGYLVAVNFGPSTVTRDFKGSHDTIPSEATVVLTHASSYDVDDSADPGKLEIGPYGAVVVSWDYVAKELYN